MNGHDVCKNKLLNLFTWNQVEYLVKKEMKVNKLRPKEWSNSKIKKALRLKFTCGNTGYDELLR